MPTVEEVMKKYVETRDLIAEKKEKLDKELEPLLGFQKAREDWLTAQLDAAGVNSMAAKGVATAFFKKNEWVKVEDWNVFLREVILKPVAERLQERMGEDEGVKIPVEDYLELLAAAFPFEFFVKNVVKDPVINLMGEVVIEKDETGKVIKEARPNPPPPGISYGAKRVLQVNKK